MDSVVASDAYILDMTDVPKEDRKTTAARSIARRVLDERDRIILDTLRGKEHDFLTVEQAVTGLGDRLVLLRSRKDYPIELIYLDREPLIGFLPPSVTMGEGGGVTVETQVLDSEDMPAIGDKRKQCLLYIMGRMTLGENT
jgi:hypothetical protein